MNLLLLLFLAAVTVHSPSLSEAQDSDGVRLLRACGAAVKKQDGMNVSDQDMLESLWCIGYVQGFIDSISVTQWVTGSRQGVCLPPQGVANDQAVRIL
jgi:hypothetical protein